MDRITIKKALDICNDMLEGKKKENIVLFADSYYTEQYLINRIAKIPGVYDMVSYSEAPSDSRLVMCNPFMSIEDAIEKSLDLELPLIYIAGVSYKLNNPKNSGPVGLTCYQCYNPDALTASQLIELLSERTKPDATVTIDGGILGYIDNVQSLGSSDIILHIQELESDIPAIKEK